MPLFLLLLLCSLWATLAQSTAHGLLQNSTLVLRCSGWYPRNPRFTDKASVYSKVNNSVSFEDFDRVVEHRNSTTHVNSLKTEIKLRILVPTKSKFHEFVKVDQGPKGNIMIVTGYSMDVFKEVMASLPYPVSYEFFPYKGGHSNVMGYYDELIQQLHDNRYDGVVGDITITSNRSNYGDFTLPYLLSEVSTIVPIVDSHIKCRWWFLKPLTMKLWVVMIALFLSKGILVWIFENERYREFKGTFSELVGEILSFSFSIFVFAQKEKLKSNYSRLVVNLWIFAMFVLVTAYAGILQSMLSSDNEGPIVTSSIESLIKNGDYVGYQKGSFVFDLLKHKGFQEQKLKAYSSIKEYATALSRGSHNNGVSAIIDEIPYIKVFLAKYADRYTMAGPTFEPSGFGFLFQRGCAVVPDISRAILKFNEGEKMSELKKKWFGSQAPNSSPPETPQREMRLSTHGFLGIFLITEPVTVITLLIFIVSIIFKHWQAERSPTSNKAKEASNTEEFFNRFYVQMNGGPANEGSHDNVEGNTNQATPKGSL